MAQDQNDTPTTTDPQRMQAALEGLASLTTIIRMHDRDLWQVSEPPFAKLRHIHTHLSKSVGRLASIVEPLDHRADADGAENVPSDSWPEDLGPIVADLIIHAAQLAELSGLDLSFALHQRWVRNSERFAPASEFATVVKGAAVTSEMK